MYKRCFLAMLVIYYDMVFITPNIIANIVP